MKRWFLLCLIVVLLPVMPTRAQTIKWVDFGVPYESMKYAMEQDIATFEQEKHISWIDILALAACRTGGKCPISSVRKAATELQTDQSPQDLLGQTYQYFDYYHKAYSAALGGLLGSYEIEVNDEPKAT